MPALPLQLRRVSNPSTAGPRPHGGSMFRIYRDVRFAKDKRPYKEHAACHFRHALGKDVHAPGFYMHFAPGEVFFGGGLWMPPPEALNKISEAIAARTAAWKKVLEERNFRKKLGGGSATNLARLGRCFAAEVGTRRRGVAEEE